MTLDSLQITIAVVAAVSWPALWLVALTKEKHEPPPLFCWLIERWYETFGESDASEMGFSVVFGVVAIVLPMSSVSHICTTLCFLLLS